MDKIDLLLDQEDDKINKNNNNINDKFYNLWTDYNETIEILGMNSNEIDFYLEDNSQKNQVKDALFTTAEVLGKEINVLIDTGSKGCVVTKCFLDKMCRNIDEPSNVWVVDITGHKSVPLGRVKDIPIQLGTKIILGASRNYVIFCY